MHYMSVSAIVIDYLRITTFFFHINIRICTKLHIFPPYSHYIIPNEP